MDAEYGLAIDLGASGGRHILGRWENNELKLEEVHRFANGCAQNGGRLFWDTEALFGEILRGLEKCREQGKIPACVGIATWGVDYVLLDEQYRELGPAYAYRDKRGGSSMAGVEGVAPAHELYRRTGIARQPYNSVYQLWDDKETGRLARAAHLLMLPEYFHWRLTGSIRREYTNATTTGLIDAATGQWDMELIGRLGYPAKLFAPLSRPGTFVGGLLPEVQNRVGFDCKVILPATHDTASAVACGQAPLYISSGTWSLMGTLLEQPLLDERARRAGFTNEGGADGRIRFLKNIMGLWMIQQIKREQPAPTSYEQLMNLAMDSAFDGTVNVQDEIFLAPKSMSAAVRKRLGRPELPLGGVVRAVYHSLAECYAQTAREAEDVTGLRCDTIRIFGGGSGDRYLNMLTQEYTGKKVVAGPKEATAMGILTTMRCPRRSPEEVPEAI
ncbi:MAG: rhamnulokinase [Oscillospiraceae bacterium]|jgi:rhamnulokinase|nr:rhamnulokinase [Oscillospiraceae bacterium]